MKPPTHVAYAQTVFGKARMTYTDSVEAKAYYAVGFMEATDAPDATIFALRDTAMTPIALVNHAWVWQTPEGPVNGTDPEALFLEWKDTTREDIYQAFKRDMDILFPA